MVQPSPAVPPSSQPQRSQPDFYGPAHRVFFEQLQSHKNIAGNRGRTPGSSAQVGWPRQRIRFGRYGMIGWPGMLSRSPR